MSSTKEYLDFILEQLSDLDEISFRAMMPNADMEQPYDGAKQMILVDDIDNRGVMYRLIQAIWEDLPKRK